MADWSEATVQHVAQNVLRKLYDTRIFAWTYCLFLYLEMGNVKRRTVTLLTEGWEQRRKTCPAWSFQILARSRNFSLSRQITYAKRSSLVALYIGKHVKHLLMFHSLLPEAKTWMRGPWRESSWLVCDCMSCLVTISLVSNRHLGILCLRILFRKSDVMTAVC